MRLRPSCVALWRRKVARGCPLVALVYYRITIIFDAVPYRVYSRLRIKMFLVVFLISTADRSPRPLMIIPICSDTNYDNIGLPNYPINLIQQLAIHVAAETITTRFSSQHLHTDSALVAREI